MVLLASSTANNQLTAYDATLLSLTLTEKSGGQVSVLAQPVGDEFLHLNGRTEPLVTLNIPQGVYVSASASGGAIAFCSGQVPGNDFTAIIGGSATVKVNLPQPITITGGAMTLVLDLQATPSTPFSGGCPESLTFVPISTPTFNLQPVDPNAAAAAGGNLEFSGLQGLIASVDPGGASLTLNSISGYSTNAPAWHAALSSSTVFQGVAGASQLASGLPVDFDMALQPDGSLVVTRIEVLSTNTTNLTLMDGLPIEVTPSITTTRIIGTSWEGYLSEPAGGPGPVIYSSAKFQVSGQLGNLAALPFTPSFTAANFVPGQNLALTTQATALTGGPAYIPIATVTLIPQTIDGKVTSVSSQGNFTTYTIQLPAYSVFPQFAVQPMQNSLLTDPSTMVVYADASTRMLNTGTIAAGSAFRFYGLVFNDNGVLRMDCAQVNDGVAE
ncbi:MAG: hypothetical protein ACLGPM_09490 [Acidobacteriota bacterium]